jgi:hypothetical protein
MLQREVPIVALDRGIRVNGTVGDPSGRLRST